MSDLLPENALATGHSGHEIYVVRGGTRHWVPDTWTMLAEGLSPRCLVIVDDDLLEELPLGEPLTTAVPSPCLASGTVVVTESGLWQVCGDQLERVTDPELSVGAAYDPERLVVWLPDSVVRGARRDVMTSPRRARGADRR